MVQILGEFERRTEYSVLKGMIEYTNVSIDNIERGTLVIPGFLLKKLDEADVFKIKQWVEDRNNHLILLPSWAEIDLSRIFEIALPVKVRDIEEIHYKDIPVKYVIDTMAKDVLFTQDGNVLGLNVRKNTGCGLITVVTLPLLDYKLIEFEEQFREILLALIEFNKNVKAFEEEDKMDLVLDDMHINLIILAAVDFSGTISDKYLKYFGKKVPEDELKSKLIELNQDDYVKDRRLTDKANKIIDSRGLKTFIKVVKEREVKSGGWE